MSFKVRAIAPNIYDSHMMLLAHLQIYLRSRFPKIILSSPKALDAAAAPIDADVEVGVLRRVLLGLLVAYQNGSPVLDRDCDAGCCDGGEG